MNNAAHLSTFFGDLVPNQDDANTAEEIFASCVEAAIWLDEEAEETLAWMTANRAACLATIERRISADAP